MVVGVAGDGSSCILFVEKWSGRTTNGLPVKSIRDISSPYLDLHIECYLRKHLFKQCQINGSVFTIALLIFSLISYVLDLMGHAF